MVFLLHHNRKTLCVLLIFSCDNFIAFNRGSNGNSIWIWWRYCEPFKHCSTPVVWKVIHNHGAGYSRHSVFLFVPIALDQAFEFLRHNLLCDSAEPVWKGDDFIVCNAAKMPLNSAAGWVHDLYGFGLALLSFAIVFGAFAANTLSGAMSAVPKSQLETAAAFGMNDHQIFKHVLLPQMWVFALPGLSNLWMILVKATPLLFLLGVEDVVYWARELGGSKTSAHSYPHGDWRIWYFIFLLVFYLTLTWLSEKFFTKLMKRFSMGQATVGGSEVML